MPNKVLEKLNSVLYRALSSLTDDCRHLRKQLKTEKLIKDTEILDILKQFKSVAISNSLNLEDKVSKTIELSCYYIAEYEKRINPTDQSKS